VVNSFEVINIGKPILKNISEGEKNGWSKIIVSIVAIITGTATLINLITNQNITEAQKLFTLSLIALLAHVVYVEYKVKRQIK